MKLTIERGALLKSLAHVQSVVERRNTIPILSNVLLEAGDGTLGLTATDMDLTIVESIAAIVAEPGATTAPAHTLYDIVRKLPEGAQIQLEGGSDSGQIVLRAGRSRFSLQTLPKDDFPAAGSGTLPNQFAIAGSDLKTLIDRTRFAISTEETRYYLNGIYVHAAKSGDLAVLRAVATDGHRLARFEMPLPLGAAEMPGVIVPRKTVGELRKLIDEIDERVDVSLSDSRVRFAFGALVLTSKLIDGTFPDSQLRRGRRPRLDDLQREVARRQAQPQDQGADPVGDQRREWQRQRGARGRLCRKCHGNRLQRSLSPRYSAADPGRGRAVHARRFGFSDGGPGRGRWQCALCPDADAGVTRSSSPARPRF